MKTAKYNKSEIFKTAWKVFRNNEFETFGESLRYAWHLAKNGDVFTFEQIYKEYKDRLLFFIRGYVKSEVVAEEILQDVFIKVNEHKDNYDVYKAKLNTWLYSIAKNKVVDYFRSKENNKGL